MRSATPSSGLPQYSCHKKWGPGLVSTKWLHGPGKRWTAHHSSHLKLDTTLGKRQWTRVGWTTETNVAFKKKSHSLAPRDIWRTMYLNLGLVLKELNVNCPWSWGWLYTQTFPPETQREAGSWQGLLSDQLTKDFLCFLWLSDDVIMHLWAVILYEHKNRQKIH